MKTYANIDSGIVIALLQYEKLPVFHPSIIMVDVTGRPDIKVGMLYKNKKFYPAPVVPEVITVPSSVTRAQGKYALIKAGRWEQLCAFVDTLPAEDKQIAELALNDTLTWKRTSPFLNQMVVAVGMSEAELDDLFIV